MESRTSGHTERKLLVLKEGHLRKGAKRHQREEKLSKCLMTLDRLESLFLGTVSTASENICFHCYQVKLK